MSHLPNPDIERLVARAQAAMEDGDLETSMALLQEALRLNDDPAVRTQLALFHFVTEDMAAVVSTLSPLVESDQIVPVALALLSLAEQAQGNELAARRHLRRAIEAFDKLAGKQLHLDRDQLDEWAAQTHIVKRAAGALGDHRLVLDLHGRWPGRERPYDLFYAGVAAFNLQRYQQAQRSWMRTHETLAANDDDEPTGIEPYLIAAALAENGVLPPLSLEYIWPADQPDDALLPDDEGRVPALTTGWGRIDMLADALDFADLEATVERMSAPWLDDDPTDDDEFDFADIPPDDMPFDEMDAALLVDNPIRQLVTETGDWGRELGQNMLLANELPFLVKMAAARALFVSDETHATETFTIRHDGEDTQVDVTDFEILEMDDMMGHRLERAQELHEDGDDQGAVELLEPMLRLGWLYPEAAVLLAGLYISVRRSNEAAMLYEVLAGLTDNGPNIIYALAVALLQAGERDAALQTLARIPDEQWPAEMKEAVAQLRVVLEAGVGA